MDETKGKIALYHGMNTVEENVTQANTQSELIRKDGTAPAYVITDLNTQDDVTDLIQQKIDKRKELDAQSAALTKEINELNDNELLTARNKVKGAVESWCNCIIALMVKFAFKCFQPGKGTPQGILSKPKNLQVEAGLYAGTFIISCDPVKGASVYKIQVCEADPTLEENWKDEDITKTSKHEIKGKTTGKIYWFRMGAFGTEGLGPWSDPAGKVCP